MRRSIKVLLWAIAIGFFLPICPSASAKSAVTELTQMPELTDWILDESGSMLYAISKKEKSLLCINAATMQVEQSITFLGGPTDLLLDGRELYVAVDSEKEICVVDTESKAVTRTIKTESDPYKIAKDGKRLYYAEYDQWCMIYEYDLETDKQKKFLKRDISDPDIVVNTKEHILYVGESNSTGANLYYYSTITGEEIKTPDYTTRPELYLPKRDIRFDGEYVFYGDIRVDPLNLTKIHGDYGSRSNKVLAVRNGLVYKENGIFDRNSHCMLGSYQAQPTLVEASKTAVFLYSVKTNKIQRFTDGEQSVTNKNVITLISGNEKEPVAESLKANKHIEAYKTLDMKYSLSDMILVEETNTIYAISSTEKAMFFMNATTMDLEKTMTFPSSPTAIAIHDDLVYVGLADAKQIVTINATSRTIKDRYHVSIAPKEIATGQDSICYTDRERVYILDKSAGSETNLGVNISSLWHIAYDEMNQILYYTRSYSGINRSLYYFDIKTKKSIGSTKDYRSDYCRIFLDEDYVYFSGYRFDKVDPSKVVGCYDEKEEILLLKNGRVYTETYIYDAETYDFIEYNFAGGMANLFDAYASGKMLYYSKEDKLIEMVDEANIKTVVFDSDCGIYQNMFIVDKGTYLTEPKAPIRKGYEFLGWYNAQKNNVKWDFKKNQVVNDVYLIAKWAKKITTPTGLKTVAFGDGGVIISWEGDGTAGQYQVYRATSPDGPYTLLGTTKELKYVDSTGENGTTYYYKVRAFVQEAGVKHYSGWTDVKSAKIPIRKPCITLLERLEDFSIYLTWSEVQGAHGYEVYRSTSKNGTYSLVMSTSKTELREKKLTPNAMYYYKVRAYELMDGKRVYSDDSEVKGVSLNISSATIGTLAVSGVQSNKIDLNWKHNNGGFGYEVYRATNSNGPFVYQGIVNSYYFSQSNLVSGRTYYYRIRPFIEQDGKKYYGSYSPVVQAKTSMKSMSKLNGNAANNATNSLSYGKISGMQGYEVYRATSVNGTYTLIGTSTGASYTDKKAAAGQVYYYKVRGFCTIGKEKSYTSYSNVVKVTTVVVVPDKLKAVKKNKTCISISWNGVKDASGYEVYQATSKNGSYKKLGAIKGKSITSGGLKKGQTYYYKVRAYRQIGNKKVYSQYTKVIAIKLN